ncbi:MAG: Na+-transporting NADH:ubiquinone oxidoreductase subunit A [Candidatus Latescibacterota bacterium]|jgi:Na+-transporting NADH:ubiquinone oxidoreductase subunit A
MYMLRGQIKWLRSQGGSLSLLMASSRIKIKRGLDLPITGSPEQVIENGAKVRHVAVIGPDYIGMRPTMAVAEGDQVALGQVLFEDKRTPGVLFTAPASGKVIAVNRGAKRALQSVVIEVAGNAEERFEQFSDVAPEQLSREQVRDKLVASGLWPALRTRPYSKVPALDSAPHSLFVTVIDTNPLAADPQVVLIGQEEDFALGLKVLGKLSDGPVYLCKAPGATIAGAGAEEVEFAGPHPAGLPGTHIHFLDPVGPEKTVWHINYQDVIAVGKLFATGRLSSERVIALAGPQVERPRLIRTLLGACVSELVAGELKDGENRVISGSVLAGRTTAGPFDFLGRYHVQVSVLGEGREREFLGWQKPGFDKFSIKNVYVAKLFPGKLFDFTTSTEGSDRAMVPISAYEKIMPLDIVPVFLLRALIVGDSDQAQLLGCLELDEDDLGLCTFVCPGKYEYGSILRNNLEKIEMEG